MATQKKRAYFNVNAQIEGDFLVFRVDLRQQYGLTEGGNLGIAKTGRWPMQLPGGMPREDGLSYNLSVWRDPTEAETDEYSHER